jgi:hypothetical protein
MFIAGALQFTGAPQTVRSIPEVVLTAGETASIGQVKTICAGSDAELISARTDPASGTSLHLALVDHGGDFVDNATIIMIDGPNLAQPRLRVRCRGDWLLMEMKPGPYTVMAFTSSGVRKRSVQVPKDARLRVTMVVERNPVPVES